MARPQSGGGFRSACRQEPGGHRGEERARTQRAARDDRVHRRVPADPEASGWRRWNRGREVSFKAGGALGAAMTAAPVSEEVNHHRVREQVFVTTAAGDLTQQIDVA